MRIMINGQVIQNVGSLYVGEINNVSIMCGFGTIVDKRLSVMIGNYVYDACMRCEGIITYNNTIIPKEGIKEPIFR